MNAALQVLGRLGNAGLVAPPLALAAGVLVPGSAALGHALLVPAVFLLLGMSVAMAEAGRLQLREFVPVGALVGCNLILCPLLAHLLALSLGLDEMGGWLVLVAACPAAGGAAMVAGLLGLPMRPMVLAQLACFALLPLTAPLIAWLVLEGATIDPILLLQRVLLLVGLPSLFGLLLRRAMGERRRKAMAPALRGLGVLALCVIGLAIVDGMPRAVAQGASLTEGLAGLFVVSLLGAVLGATAGRLTGRSLIGTLALGGAVRNVSLLWSATLGVADPGGELVMQLGTLWTLVLPSVLALPRLWSLRFGALGRALALLLAGFALLA